MVTPSGIFFSSNSASTAAGTFWKYIFRWVFVERQATGRRLSFRSSQAAKGNISCLLEKRITFRDSKVERNSAWAISEKDHFSFVNKKRKNCVTWVLCERDYLSAKIHQKN
jgi:hypothetical protein